MADELAKMLLKNPTVASAVNGLTSISLFFEAIFGIGFSINHIIAFFVAICFFLYVLGWIKKTLELFSPFNSLANFSMSLGFNIGLAYFGTFKFLGILTEKFILEFSWFWKIFVIIAIIVVLSFGKKLFSSAINKLIMKKKIKEEEEKKEQLDHSLKQAETVINPYVDAFSQGSGIKDDSDHVKISLKPLGDVVNRKNSTSSPAPNINPSLEEDDGDRHRGGGGD